MAGLWDPLTRSGLGHNLTFPMIRCFDLLWCEGKRFRGGQRRPTVFMGKGRLKDWLAGVSTEATDMAWVVGCLNYGAGDFVPLHPALTDPLPAKKNTTTDLLPLRPYKMYPIRVFVGPLRKRVVRFIIKFCKGRFRICILLCTSWGCEVVDFFPYLSGLGSAKARESLMARPTRINAQIAGIVCVHKISRRNQKLGVPNVLNLGSAHQARQKRSASTRMIVVTGLSNSCEWAAGAAPSCTSPTVPCDKDITL